MVNGSDELKVGLSWLYSRRLLVYQPYCVSETCAEPAILNVIVDERKGNLLKNASYFRPRDPSLENERHEGSPRNLQRRDGADNGVMPLLL